MKVIDLLNKIANDEISNKAKFKWKDSVIVNKKGTLYMNDMYFSKILNLGNYGALNDEIEPIEEEQDIKELWIDDSGYIHTELGSWKGRKMDIAFATKINEVVKEVNKQKNNEEVL